MNYSEFENTALPKIISNLIDKLGCNFPDMDSLNQAYLTQLNAYIAQNHLEHLDKWLANVEIDNEFTFEDCYELLSMNIDSRIKCFHDEL